MDKSRKLFCSKVDIVNTTDVSQDLSLEELEKRFESRSKEHELAKKKLVNQQVELDNLKEALTRAREKQYSAQLETEEKQEAFTKVLSLMAHSSRCTRNKPASSYSFYETIPGIISYDSGKKEILCRKCALEYCLENPWVGYGFRVSVDIDLNGEGEFE